MPVDGCAQSLVLESGTPISGLDSENHEVGQGPGSVASKGVSSSSGSSGCQEDAAEDCLSAQGARATARRSRCVVLHGFGMRTARPAAKRMRLRTASVRRRRRERLHAVVAASSSTVSGCELPGG